MDEKIQSATQIPSPIQRISPVANQVLASNHRQLGAELLATREGGNVYVDVGLGIVALAGLGLGTADLVKPEWLGLQRLTPEQKKALDTLIAQQPAAAQNQEEPKKDLPSPSQPDQESETQTTYFFSITGVPQTVDKNNLPKWANEKTPAPGDVGHKNTIGFNTEAFLAEPGVRTADYYSKEEEKKDSAVWLITGDRQQKLTGEKATWPINEDGFTMLTGATMKLEFRGITVTLGRQEKHGWIVIIKGFPRHNQPDTDNNIPLHISEFDSGFITATMLPPGQYVSQDYLNQNADAVQGIYNLKQDPSGCGVDGCTRVSVVMIDAQTGGYTIIKRDNRGKWELGKTNIQ